MTERAPELTRDELAMMAAFEARTGDVARGFDPSNVSAELQGELDAFVALTNRVGALQLAPVRPSVRSAIMNAAVAQVESNAQSANPLARLLVWLMRPGPALIGATGVALVAAMFVRTVPVEEQGRAANTMVAMAEKPVTAAASENPAASEQAGRTAEFRLESNTAKGAPGQGANSAAPPAVPNADRALRRHTNKRRTFAAQPASLGPAAVKAGEESANQGLIGEKSRAWLVN